MIDNRSIPSEAEKEHNCNNEDGSNTSGAWRSQYLFKISLIVLVISTLGLVIQIVGLIWDTFSHLLDRIENFYTRPHIVLYTGVGILTATCSFCGILVFSIEKDKRRRQKLGQKREPLVHIGTYNIIPFIRLLVIGTGIQLFGGGFDFWWHSVYGFYGLGPLPLHYSIPHAIFIAGLLVNAIGATLGLVRIRSFVQPPILKSIKVLTMIAFSTFWFSGSATIAGIIGMFSTSQGELSRFIILSRITESMIGIVILPLLGSVLFLVMARWFSLFLWDKTPSPENPQGRN